MITFALVGSVLSAGLIGLLIHWPKPMLMPRSTACEASRPAVRTFLWRFGMSRRGWIARVPLTPFRGNGMCKAKCRFSLGPARQQGSSPAVCEKKPDRAETKEVAKVWFKENNFERLRRARELAKGGSPNQIALAYVLSQSANIFALVGPENIEELRESLATLHLRLSDSERHWLNLERQTTTIGLA